MIKKELEIFTQSTLWVQLSNEGNFLVVAEAEGKGGKTTALKVKAEGEAEGFGILYLSIRWAYSDIGFERP